MEAFQHSFSFQLLLLVVGDFGGVLANLGTVRGKHVLVAVTVQALQERPSAALGPGYSFSVKKTVILFLDTHQTVRATEQIDADGFKGAMFGVDRWLFGIHLNWAFGDGLVHSDSKALQHGFS